MSDSPTPEPADKPAPNVVPNVEPKTEQDQPPAIDWKAEARKWEQRSKDNADAARRLAEIEDAQKTVAQRQAEALQAAQSERDAAVLAATRFRVAAAHGISDADAELFLTGPDEDTVRRQAEALQARESGRPRAPKPDQNQGRNETSSPSLGDQFAAALGQHFT